MQAQTIRLRIRRTSLGGLDRATLPLVPASKEIPGLEWDFSICSGENFFMKLSRLPAMPVRI